MLSGMNRHGLASHTVIVCLTLMIVSIQVMAITSARHGAHQALDRAYSLRDATAVGESALEEAMFQIRTTRPGSELLKPGRIVTQTIPPSFTRRLADQLVGGWRVSVSDVRVVQIGSVVKDQSGSGRGTIAMEVNVAIRTRGIVGNFVERKLVRWYRFEVHGVRGLDGGDVPVFEQIRVRPRPIAQWMVAS